MPIHRVIHVGACVALVALAGDASSQESASMEATPSRAGLSGLFSVRSGAALPLAGAVDVTPPVLTAFKAEGTFNVNRQTPQFSIQFTATDDNSGVRSAMFQAVGPSGQRIFALTDVTYPAKTVSRRLGFNPYFAARLLQPGVWRIDHARIEDVAGNPGKYGAAALAALGNATITVTNSGSYDTVAPTLTGGQVLTTSVSLSGTARGAPGQAPFVGMKVQATDTGSTATAGVAGAGFAFCLAEESRCLELWASNGGTVNSATFLAGAQVSPTLGHVPGVYHLYSVVVYDQAGNFRELVSTFFGGSTNFAAMMPTTTITLAP